MSDHPQLRDLLGPYVMGALEPVEEREVEEHLQGCAECTAEVADLRLAHEQLMSLVGMEETPPRALKGRVIGGMPRRESRRLPVLAAAAAVLCALVVLGVLYSAGVFTPEEVAAADLQATELAPQAGGELRVREEDPNAQAELEVWGLPRPEPNQYYELWFGEEGGRVSAGTFTVGEGGRETLYMTVPEEASGYGQVGITLEEFPKEPRISAAKPVLVGELQKS